MKLIKASLLGALLLGSVSATAVPLTYFEDFSAGAGPEWSTVVLGGGFLDNGDAGILGQLHNVAAELRIDALGGGGVDMVFDLLGFRTVDGANCCTDTFRLWHNGVEVFAGQFAMGGGGVESILINDVGAIVGAPELRRREFSITNLALTAGVNVFRFDYGIMQGFGDEAWGLDNVGLRGDVAPRNPGNNVPEPTSLLVLATGLLGLGARRRHF